MNERSCGCLINKGIYVEKCQQALYVTHNMDNLSQYTDDWSREEFDYFAGWLTKHAE